VPKSCHLCKQVRMQYEHTVTVGRGSSQQVESEILVPGCVLRWGQWPPHSWAQQEGAAGVIGDTLSSAGGSLHPMVGTSALGSS
jgi:hypothetical protein